MWAGLESRRYEVATGDQRRRDEGFVRKLLPLAEEEIVVVEQAMRALAIHAVEFEFVVDRWSSEEALERGDAHVLNILEGHVVFHPGHGCLRFGVGKPQPREDFFRHRGADRFVTVEPNAAGLVDVERWRLADVVE